MYIPITLSCIWSFFEKQTVFLFSCFRCILKLRFLRSIFHVLSFPIRCLSGGIYFEYAPQSSVWYLLIGNVFNSSQSIKKPLSFCFPLCYAKMISDQRSIAHHVQRRLSLFCTKLQKPSISADKRISTSNCLKLYNLPHVRK
jgi:hypothetical protein